MIAAEAIHLVTDHADAGPDLAALGQAVEPALLDGCAAGDVLLHNHLSKLDALTLAPSLDGVALDGWRPVSVAFLLAGLRRVRP